MKTKVLLLLFGSILCCFLTAGPAGATVDTVEGEEALFTTSTAPDALILLDLSGSMAWNPPGDNLPYGATDSCVADSTNCSGTGCKGGFCGSSKSGVTYYAAAACGTADTTNCVGANCENGFCSSSKGATMVYASSSCSTPDVANCRGTGCGRSDGFCNSSTSGGTTYYAHASCSVPDTNNCRYSENWRDCANGFCSSSHYSSWSGRDCRVQCTTTPCATECPTAACSTQCVSGGCTKDCSRLAIAKRSVFNILDDNNDNAITNADETSLGVRLGYMRFYNCSDDESSVNYSSGCNTLVKAINSSYSSINTAVSAESALGGTPIASALSEAKLYLDTHKAADTAKGCRQKFVILITDGSDTYACNADGGECDSHRYKNRREVVARAKMLSDAGYKVFVIGFGSAMPPYLANTLNWMAYYGGTDNPNSPNSGSVSAYSIATGCNANPAVPSACCNVYTAACYPSGVTGCGTDSSAVSESCWDKDKPYPGTGYATSSFRAASNDPGYLDLSGYAFLAADANQLVAAVKAAITIIREATYSFSQASVQSSRTQDENYIYEGSFQPITGDPFWRGHFKKYNIDSDGTVTTLKWIEKGITDGDAGTKLRDRPATDLRKVYTFKGGNRVEFNATQMTAADLGLTTTAERDAAVSYIRGDSTPDNWKLGDVFRATPITVGNPSIYFDDIRDTGSTPNAFAAHRNAHPRPSAGNDADPRIVLAGANDGQLHAFKAEDGAEAWSFIPPNQLPRLKLIVHTAEPTSLTHQYYVDGPVTVADAWIPETAASGKSKSLSPNDWRTLAIFAEGRGGSTTLWSSSSSCDSGFNGAYSTTYPYYCGYFCLDLTNSATPVMQWPKSSKPVGIELTASQAPYMGAPWSKMMVGRVLIGRNERWVGFIGGGVYAAGGANSGKGFFVVDLYDGHVLWSYTRADNSALDYPMPAAPAIVDTDNDGFIDTVYIGDLGSNMWRFKFPCQDTTADASCGTGNWTGGLLFDASGEAGNRPIYTSAAVSRDPTGNLWVYWGTGDKTDPTNASAQERFIGMKDNDRSTTRTISAIENVDGSGDVYDNPDKYGYYINFSGHGEKMLADPTVFGGVVYFTTFTPPAGNNPCEQGGAAKLYGLNYTTGGGALTTTDTPRSMDIGTGIASAPILSMKPSGGTTPDLYVTTSGGGGIGAQTQRVDIDPPGAANRTNMLYWRDRRVDQ